MKAMVTAHLLPVLAACVAGMASVVAWETADQAARQAVDLITDPHVFGVATLSTTYPSNFTDEYLRGKTISGPEYFAPCFASEGDLLFLGLTVSQSWRNVLVSKGKEATVSVASNPDPAVPDKRHLAGKGSHHWDRERPSWRRGMPSKGRATLFGHFENLSKSESSDSLDALAKCYLSHHPDASRWAPGSSESPHVPFWARFVVDKVYWVGGFGDEHFIGWLDKPLWQRAWQETSSKGPKPHAAFSDEHSGTSESTDARLEQLFAPTSSAPEPQVVLRFQAK